MSLAAFEQDFKSRSMLEVKGEPSLVDSLTHPRVQIVPIGEEQLDEFQDFLLRLDRDSRCRRFGHAASDDAMITHARTALSEAGRVIAIAPDSTLRGVI